MHVPNICWCKRLQSFRGLPHFSLKPRPSACFTFSGVDIAIVILYFVSVLGDRLLSQEVHQNRRGFLPGRKRNDGLGRRPELPRRQPGLARTDGLGRQRLSIWHSRRALVLDRRHSRHALPGHGDDPVLLHLARPIPSRAISSCASASRRARFPPSPSAS